jgi:hypothetical protein
MGPAPETSFAQLYSFCVSSEFIKLHREMTVVTCDYILLAEQGTWPCLSLLRWANTIHLKNGDSVLDTANIIHLISTLSPQPQQTNF